MFPWKAAAFVTIPWYIASAEVISGMVLDSSGLAVPNVPLTLRCAGETLSLASDPSGHFVFQTAVLSRCTITASRHGFTTVRKSLGSQTRTLVIRLAVAPLTQAVNVVALHPDSDPLLRATLATVSMTDEDLRKISNNTADLIRHVKLLAGTTGDTDAIYVDGLPSDSLPPAEMIARITINADPFSAEYAEGGQTHIDIVTKHATRKFRLSLNGDSPGLGGRNALAPQAHAVTRSGSVSIRGPVPGLPITFSLRTGFGFTRSAQPVLANLPDSRLVPWEPADREAPATNRSQSHSLNLHWSPGEAVQAHLTYQETRSHAENAGVGGLSLSEAGLSSSLASREVRTSLSATRERYTYRGGLVLSQLDSNTLANSAAAGVSVAGEFVAGGAPISSSRSSNSRWTWKNVVGSHTALPWTAGFVLATAGDLNHIIPNPLGFYQFSTTEMYLHALEGEGTGTWFVTRGDGLVRYRRITAAPFVQKRLIQSASFVLNGGVRADYQSELGMMMSPRISAAARLAGFVLRAGGGLFAREVPNAVFVKVMAGDSSHLRQYILSGASLTESFAKPTIPVNIVQSRLAGDLARPRELMLKTSVERRLKSLTPGVEYTWARDRRMLGVRRLLDQHLWANLFESNRAGERHTVHARLEHRRKTGSLVGYYEWTRSRDNTDGALSAPSPQNDIRLEWARSAGVPAHGITVVANCQLPASISATLIHTWRSSAPFNITTGFDPGGHGLYNDRGGRARNSGDGPGFSALSLYGYRRFALPTFGVRSRKATAVNLGVHADNLVGNRNYAALGSVLGAGTFGRPLAALPGRSVRFWFGFD